MTAQIADRVRHRGSDFSLARVDGSGLFDPAAYGITPQALHSACWRGYYCTYGIEGGRLVLKRVQIGLQGDQQALAARGEGPRLLNALPHPGDSRQSFFYDSLAAPLAFTGGLLLGRDFIRNLYVHMGYHPAWKYQQVLELLFEEGVLRAEYDRSEAMADIRTALTPESLRPRRGDRDELRAWIERCFSLRYRRTTEQPDH